MNKKDKSKINILLFGFDTTKWSLMTDEINAYLRRADRLEKYNIIFANTNPGDGLEKVIIATTKEKSPIDIVIFERDTLVNSRPLCVTLNEFASKYLELFYKGERKLMTINLLYNRQDKTAKALAVGENIFFCDEHNWESIFYTIEMTS